MLTFQGELKMLWEDEPYASVFIRTKNFLPLVEARKLINVFALARSLDAEKALRIGTLATQAIEDNHESSRMYLARKAKIARLFTSWKCNSL